MTSFRLLLAVVCVSASSVAAAQTCLHGASETEADRSRREQALRLAVAIHQAQPTIVGPRPAQPPSKPWHELTNLPRTPDGFVVQYQSNGEMYSFSIKDALDPCRYAIFSDQDRALYEATPTNRAIIVPLTGPAVK